MTLGIFHVNIVDLIALVVFAMYILRSWYTGLWPWVNGLVSLVVSFYFAFFGYAVFGPLLTNYFHNLICRSAHCLPRNSKHPYTNLL
jgi:uncharacterized membrane protein required for colicin V production